MNRLIFLALAPAVLGQQPLKDDGEPDLKSVEIQSGATVCVTGASGYVASVLVNELLNDGYKVVGTVRDVEKYKKEKLFEQVELYKADLLQESSFDEPFSKCDALMHTASPFWVGTGGADPTELFVKPAKEGTLNVLKAAKKAGIDVVVVTSSTAAVTPQHNREEKYHDQRAKKAGKPAFYSREFNEDDWNMDSTLDEGPYRLSKRLAEQAAWKFAQENDLRLTVMNPSFVLGPPVLTRVTGESCKFMEKMLSGNFSESGAPPAVFGVIDVRDLARAHIQGMRLKGAKGKRFVLSSRVAHSAFEIGEMVMAHVVQTKGEATRFLSHRLPTHEAKPVEYKNTYDHTRAARHLGIKFTSVADTVGEMALRYFDTGMVKLLSEEEDEFAGIKIKEELRRRLRNGNGL